MSSKGICLFAFVVALGLNGELVAQDDVEPARVMLLSIDGREHLIAEGAEVKIPGSFTDAKFSIRPAGYRVFQYNGLNFRYPDGMEFEAEHESDVNKTWSLGGDDASLDVLALDGDPDVYLREALDYLIEASDEPDQIVEIKKDTLKLDGVEVDTFEYKYRLFDSWSYVWGVNLPSRKGAAAALVFYREYEDGKLVKECRELEKMVLKSLKF